MTNTDSRMRRDVTVAVVREKGAPFRIESASIGAPGPEEVAAGGGAVAEVGVTFISRPRT